MCDLFFQSEVVEDLRQKLNDKSNELRTIRAEHKEQFDVINKLVQEHEENMNKVSDEHTRLAP